MFHTDFEFFLLLASLVTGLIWLIDSLFFLPRRQKNSEGIALYEPILLEYSKSFFPVLLVVLILRGFLFEPFRIPSGSMMPTLLVGDFILVNKFSYGLRLPVIHTKLNDGDSPKRGDVAVFRYPRNESLDYIKRVIGLPGDRIAYYNRRLTINGVPLQTKFDHDYQGLGELNNMIGGNGCDKVDAGCTVLVEQQSDVKYSIMNNLQVSYSADGELEVPAGHYFVMGDNRDHSSDSRVWGFVPEANLVGKAVMIWMHWDWRSNGNGLDISRVGTKISP
jgi:signal peptidase I|tara:strand:- start:216 stop:1046 length:831 start_codon:yes stop_codon:yes gene_type:complete